MSTFIGLSKGRRQATAPAATAATRLEFEADVTEGLACNYSMCQRRGSLLWFMPHAQLQVLDSQPSATYWLQVLDATTLAPRLAPIVEPTNEQNLDRLTAEVLGAPR